MQDALRSWLATTCYVEPTLSAYNLLKLPRQVVTPSGTITYTYDAQGDKLRSIGGKTRD